MDIAVEFYNHLTKDPCDVATALHQATLGLKQDYPKNPSIWASHIHIGP